MSHTGGLSDSWDPSQPPAEEESKLMVRTFFSCRIQQTWVSEVALDREGRHTPGTSQLSPQPGAGSVVPSADVRPAVCSSRPPLHGPRGSPESAQLSARFQATVASCIMPLWDTGSRGCSGQRPQVRLMQREAETGLKHCLHRDGVWSKQTRLRDPFTPGTFVPRPGVVCPSPGAWSLGSTVLMVPSRKQKLRRGSCQRLRCGVRKERLSGNRSLSLGLGARGWGLWLGGALQACVQVVHGLGDTGSLALAGLCPGKS